MARLNELHNPDGTVWGYSFYCPGCSHIHVYITHPESDKHWSFNGDMDYPTFQPSLLVNKDRTSPAYGRCHLFLTRGMIQYCNDCDHALAGKIVPLPELPPDWQ